MEIKDIEYEILERSLNPKYPLNKNDQIAINILKDIYIYWLSHSYELATRRWRQYTFFSVIMIAATAGLGYLLTFESLGLLRCLFGCMYLIFSLINFFALSGITKAQEIQIASAYQILRYLEKFLPYYLTAADWEIRTKCYSYKSVLSIENTYLKRVSLLLIVFAVLFIIFIFQQI